MTVQGKKAGNLLTRSVRERLWSGGMWATLGRVVSMPMGMVASGLLARLLSPDDLGAYFLVFTVVGIATLVAQMGLPNTVVRFVAEALGKDEPGNVRAVIRHTFLFGGLSTIVVVAALSMGLGKWLALEVYNSPVMAGVMLLAGLWVVTSTLRRLLVVAFRGFHDIRLATLLSSLDRTVLPALVFAVVWLLWKQASLQFILSLLIGIGAVVVLLGGWLLLRRLRAYTGRATITGKKILQTSFPLLISAVLLYIIDQTSFWVLGAYDFPKSEVAIYGNAYRLVNLVILSLALVNQVIPPLIAELYSQGKKEQLQAIMRGTALIAGIPALIGFIIYIFFGEPILGLIYGDFYRQAATVLTILSLGRIVNVWAGTCQIGLMMTGHQNVIMVGSILTGGISVTLALWLGPRYGAEGVAVASAVSLAFQNLLMLVLMRLKTGIWTHAGNFRQAWSLIKEQE